jgi:hypothetical protein
LEGTAIQRRCKLAAGDEADNEGVEAEVLTHMEREHRHRETDEEVGYKDHCHDRQQRR